MLYVTIFEYMKLSWECWRCQFRFPFGRSITGIFSSEITRSSPVSSTTSWENRHIRKMFLEIFKATSEVYGRFKFVIDSRTVQVFVWPADSWFRSDCLCMWVNVSSFSFRLFETGKFLSGDPGGVATVQCSIVSRLDRFIVILKTVQHTNCFVSLFEVSLIRVNVLFITDFHDNF